MFDVDLPIDTDNAFFGYS